MIRRHKGKKPVKETGIVLSQAPEVVTSRKFDLWCAYYFDSSNKLTFLNATQSALKAYNTDKDYVAWGIGSRNARKAKVLASTIADLNGFGYGDRIKIAITKALAGEYGDWDKLLVRIGDFEDKPSTLVQNNFDFSNLASAIKQDRQERGLSI